MTEPLPPITMPSTIDVPSTEKQIHDDLLSAIAAIPDGHTHGLFVDSTYSVADGFGSQLVYAEKVNDAWSFSGGVSYDGAHGVAGKVETQITW